MIEIDEMEQRAIDTVYAELSGEECIPIKLRLGEGLNEAAMDRVRNALRFLIDRWRLNPYVPKRLAAAFVDIQSSMEWGWDQYGESEQNRIEDAAVELVSLANELFDDQHTYGK